MTDGPHGRGGKPRPPAPRTRPAEAAGPRTRAVDAGDGAGDARSPQARRAPAPPTGPGDAPGGVTRAVGGAPASHIFVALPPELLEHFESVRELPSGGQASLVLCRRRGSDELVVVKVYRSIARADVADPRAALRELDPAHAVRYVPPYFGVVDGHWWEAVEYCAEGSLVDLAEAHGGALPRALLVDVVREVATALEHLHSRTPKVIHRDVKPGNVLVRSRSPLDLVLADFGLAVLTDLSRERRSGSRTVAYAAPEAAGGEASAALDWWSLGMTVAELAVGRHPYQRPDGVWFSDAQILSEVSSRPVPLDGVTDERLRLLLRGLLTRDPDARWKGREVREWLAGRSPVVRDEDRTTVVVPAGGKRVPPFPFAGTTYTEPAALAAALAADWRRAAEVVVGRDFAELVAWVDEHFPARSLQSVLRGQAQRQLGVDRTVAEIIVRLDPEAEPVFMGVPVDRRSLVKVLGALDDRTEDVVDKLFRSRALLAYASLAGHEDLALLEGQWQDFCAQATAWFAAVPEAGSMTPGARCAILLAALGELSRKDGAA